MEDYYKPPKANLVSDTGYSISPDTKLFKTSGVGVATFFGSLLAGGIIIGLNYLRMNEQVKARNTIILSFLAFAVFIGTVWFLPDSIPQYGLYHCAGCHHDANRQAAPGGDNQTSHRR